MRARVPFNLWRASHWINHRFKRGARPMERDYSHYWTHNVHVTTSGNYNTRGLKFCIEELGVDRCLYAIGELSCAYGVEGPNILTLTRYTV